MTWGTQLTARDKINYFRRSLFSTNIAEIFSQHHPIHSKTKSAKAVLLLKITLFTVRIYSRPYGSKDGNNEPQSGELRARPMGTQQPEEELPRGDSWLGRWVILN